MTPHIRARWSAPLAAAGVLAALVAFAAPAAAQTALERVRASGQLRIGMDATYPPFGMAEGGTFSGFDVNSRASSPAS